MTATSRRRSRISAIRSRRSSGCCRSCVPAVSSSVPFAIRTSDHATASSTKSPNHQITKSLNHQLLLLSLHVDAELLTLLVQVAALETERAGGFRRAMSVRIQLLENHLTLVRLDTLGERAGRSPAVARAALGER